MALIIDHDSLPSSPIVISIITVVYNNINNIRTELNSVISQKYPWVQYIEIDGGSNDGFSSKRIIAREINQSLRDNNVWLLPIFQLGRYVIRLLELLIKPGFHHHD